MTVEEAFSDDIFLLMHKLFLLPLKLFFASVEAKRNSVSKGLKEKLLVIVTAELRNTFKMPLLNPNEKKITLFVRAREKFHRELNVRLLISVFGLRNK